MNGMIARREKKAAQTAKAADDAAKKGGEA